MSNGLRWCSSAVGGNNQQELRDMGSKLRCNALRLFHPTWNLAVLVAVLVLSGCYASYPDRHIRLANERDLEHAGASYFLVDKTDRSNGAVIVSQIDSEKLDIQMDPCVYVLTPGEHMIKFEFSEDSPRRTHDLPAILQVGRYYQVIPRGSAFIVAEVSAEKFQEIRERNKTSIIRFFLFFKG